MPERTAAVLSFSLSADKGASTHGEAQRYRSIGKREGRENGPLPRALSPLFLSLLLPLSHSRSLSLPLTRFHLSPSLSLSLSALFQ
eukprot:2606754-Pleurochrysis_carterae.AAC.2